MAKVIIEKATDVKADSSMIAPIQATLTADRNYAVGDRFVYNGILYKATASITSGNAITIGTNADISEDVETQIKNATKDSGWLTLNTYVKYRKVGKVVTVHTSFPDSVITTTGWTQFGTLPSGYRPNVAIHTTPYNDNNFMQIVRIAADGAITVNGNATTYACFTYIAD